ncbi:MAG: hypothetical protein JKY04_03080 [Sneathiella sp.]|nr:hypothetical protein [Sneathiella sp.]
MEFLSVPVLLDLLLIILLGATIAYCVNLSRKLSVMRDAQAELSTVAKQFDQAIVRSKLGIADLRNASEQAGTGLQKEVVEATLLLEELKLINASSSRIADRLQESVGGAGRKINARDTLENLDEEPDPVDLSPRTEAERELLQMLTKSK